MALFVLLAATVGGVLLYWRHAELYPSTDNAYTGANVVRVASQVSGPVAHVYVATTTRSPPAIPLFDIDATLYDAALRNARAQFDAAASAAGTAADVSKAAADQARREARRARRRARQISRRQGCAEGGRAALAQPSPTR